MRIRAVIVRMADQQDKNANEADHFSDLRYTTK